MRPQWQTVEFCILSDQNNPRNGHIHGITYARTVEEEKELLASLYSIYGSALLWAKCKGQTVLMTTQGKRYLYSLGNIVNEYYPQGFDLYLKCFPMTAMKEQNSLASLAKQESANKMQSPARSSTTGNTLSNTSHAILGRFWRARP